LRDHLLVLGLIIVVVGVLMGCATAPSGPTRRLTLIDEGTPPAGPPLGIQAQFRTVQLAGNRTALGLTLRNQGTVAVQVPWDQVTIMMPNGVSSRVVHEGVRLMERDRPMVSSTIPPGGALVDFVYPSGLVRFVSGRYGGWVYDPFIDGFAPGQEFGLYIPVQTPDGIRARTVRFRVY